MAHPETQGLKPNSFEVDYVAAEAPLSHGNASLLQSGLWRKPRAGLWPAGGWGHPPHACNPLLRHFGHLALLPPYIRLEAFFAQAEGLGGYFYEFVVGDEFDGLL